MENPTFIFALICLAIAIYQRVIVTPALKNLHRI